MNKSIFIGFEDEVRMINMTSLVPNKLLPKSVSKTAKYHQIDQSIKEIGLVEPIVVYPIADETDKYVIVDGHIRYWALKNHGESSVMCLVSKDDESYTYNKRISRLSSVQEHFMILKAIDKGVSEDRIAKVLNVNIRTIRLKRSLLNGISPEVVDYIKNITIPAATIRSLKRVKPARQLEIIELLTNMGTYRSQLAKAIVKRTPVEQLVNQPKKVIKPELHFEVEQDIGSLIKETNRVKEKSGENLVQLVAIGGYLNRLLVNKRIRDYISRNFPADLQKLDEVISSVRH